MPDSPNLYSDDEKHIVSPGRGWFVTGESWSGPWLTEDAAKLARDGLYTAAHKLERSYAR